MLELKILSPSGSVTMAVSFPWALLSSAVRSGALDAPMIGSSSRVCLFQQPASPQHLWRAEMVLAIRLPLHGRQWTSASKGNEEEKQSQHNIFENILGEIALGRMATIIWERVFLFQNLGSVLAFRLSARVTVQSQTSLSPFLLFWFCSPNPLSCVPSSPEVEAWETEIGLELI